MDKNKFEMNRFFLKDIIRKMVDFSQTDQNKNLPPPPLQKPCSSDINRIDIPDGKTALLKHCLMPVCHAIINRESVRQYKNKSFTLEEISALLYATQGVRKILNRISALRTVPSAGARHSFETYLAIKNVENLAPGLYRYLPFDGQLAQLKIDPEIGEKAAQACFEQDFIANAAATFFWTAIPSRMEWRYGLAAHKVIALDCGHVCQNLYLACEGIGVGTCAIAAYDQEACDELLGIDGEEEFTIYIASVGKK